jgi:hypothetical protein
LKPAFMPLRAFDATLSGTAPTRRNSSSFSKSPMGSTRRA